MGANVAARGTLRIPRMKEWLAAPLGNRKVALDALANAPPSQKPFKGTAAQACAAVGHDQDPRARWSITTTRGALVVQGEVSDDDYRASGALLIQVLASAAAAGATGRVELAAMGDEEFAVAFVAQEKRLVVSKIDYAAAIERVFQLDVRDAAPVPMPVAAAPVAPFVAMMLVTQMADSLPQRQFATELLAAAKSYPKAIRDRFGELVAKRRLRHVMSNPSGESEDVAAALFALRVEVLARLAPTDEFFALLPALDPKSSMGVAGKRVLKERKARSARRR